MKWQPYMDECLQILATHPDALPSDRRLVWWAKLAYIMEQAGVQLTAEDPYTMISFADSKTRYTIKAFATQLAQFRRDIPEEFWTGKSKYSWRNLFYSNLISSTSGPHEICSRSLRPRECNGCGLLGRKIAQLSWKRSPTDLGNRTAHRRIDDVHSLNSSRYRLYNRDKSGETGMHANISCGAHFISDRQPD